MSRSKAENLLVKPTCTSLQLYLPVHFRIGKFEIEPPRLTIQFLRFRLSQLSDLLPLVQHYLLRPHEEEAHSD